MTAIGSAYDVDGEGILYISQAIRKCYGLFPLNKLLDKRRGCITPNTNVHQHDTDNEKICRYNYQLSYNQTWALTATH